MTIPTRRPSWVRRVFGRSPAAPLRRPRRLGCERLEDRVNPADPVVTQVDYGGLRFVASSNFVADANGDYSADEGTVSIGYTPAAAEAFRPLIQAKVESAPGKVLLYNATNPTQFNFSFATVELLPGGTPGVPIPFFEPQTSAAPPIKIADLIGTGGEALDQKWALPVPVAGVRVQSTLLQFTNPNGGDTSDAQARVQGKATFEDIELLSGLGLEADVNGTNYLISDSTGINVTGASITKTWTFDGVTVAGSITVGYDRPTSTFTMGGGVTVTNTPEPGGKAALNNLGANIVASITDGVLSQFEFNVTGSFTLFETLTVSTIPTSPLFFEYKLPSATDPSKYFRIGGGLQLQFSGQTIAADFGTEAAPGIVITNGRLTSLDATFSADLKVKGVTLQTDPAPNGLALTYQPAAPASGGNPATPSQFVISGGLTLGVAGQTIKASLGTAADPGFTIVGGKLTELNVGLAASINAFGLKLNIGTTGDPATVKWVPADDSFNITGTFMADFKVFQTRLVLGGQPPPSPPPASPPPPPPADNAKGLSIVNGKLSVPAGGQIVFDIQDAVLGPVELKDMQLTYTALTGGGVDVDVAAALALPGGWTAAGEFDLIKEADGLVKLHTISVDLSPAAGEMPIGDTGLSVVDIAVKVTNIDTPSQIVVTGDVAVVWGEAITLLGTPNVYLFRAQGNVLAGAGEFVLDCQAQFGAYPPDGAGNTWQGLLGQGDAKLTLDWADDYYALHAEVDGLAGIFNIEGDFVFESGREIAILAEAEVVVPQEVPFIGGDTIGGVGFFFQHVFAHDTTPASTTFAAWVDVHIIWSFTVGFELDYDASAKPSFSLIGGDRVAQFEQDVAPPVNQNYTFTSTFTRGPGAGQLAPGATSAVFGVDWSKSAAGVGLNGPPTFSVVKIVNGDAGDPITQDQFAANGISFVTDSNFNTPTSKAIQVVGSTADEYAPLGADYKLLVTFNTVGGNPFPSYPSTTAADVLLVEATAHVPVPSFGPAGATNPVPPTVPAGSPSAAFPVAVSGNIDEAFFNQAQVTLYRIRQSDPFQRGVKVGSAQVTPTNVAVLAVDAGGSGGAGGFAADGYVTGGAEVNLGTTIDTTHVVNPAPAAVYQSVRSSAGGEFTYTLPGLAAGRAYTVRLHFAEIGVGGVGQRKFHVDINGTRVLTDFDIAAAAGGVNTAYAQSFAATADANGQIVVAFRNGSLQTAIVSGIEVFTGPAGVNWTATFNAPVEGLYPEPYVYYAVVDDGSNPPVQSALSAPVTPAFAVQGTVKNQNGDPEAGWSVYLDYNGNNQYDPSEPLTTTNAGGFYSFAPAFPNSPGVGPVPVNTPVSVRLLVQGPQNYAPVTMPAATYTGSAAAVANFALQEFSAIKGTVFIDRNSDGVKDGDAGAAGAVVYLDLDGDGQRDPSDPTAITDTKGNYTFGGVAAGAYTVALDPLSLADTTPTPAYVVPAGTAGNLATAGAAGMTFAVTKPVVVSSLGVFDSGGDGFSGPLTVTLYDATTRSALATLTFTPAAPGTLVGGTRFLPLGTPLTLLPGFQGMIVAAGFTAADPMYNAYYANPQLPAGTTAGGLGRLTFGHGCYGPAGSFPTTQDSSTYPNPYAAGSFLFAAPPWQQTSPSPRARTVTVAGGGFSLQEGNDSGALPPAVVSGTVTGHGYVNGRLAADATPQAGVTVNLRADRLVVAYAGGPGAGHFASDGQGPVNSAPFTNPAAIDTSRVTDPAPQAVYQAGRYAPAGQNSFIDYLPVPAAGRYTIRLHFAEPSWRAAGQRVFHVDVNGTRMLTNFDVYAAAGDVSTAYVAELTVDVDTADSIAVAFVRGPAGDPFMNGIELLQPGAVVATTTTDGAGKYSFTTYVPGRYVAQVVPPAGWRQVAPYHSDLQFGAGTALPAAAGGAQAVAADFDGDGFVDVATVGEPDLGSPGVIWVGYNGQDGTFGRPDSLTVPGLTYVIALAAADLNGDGRPDLAVLNQAQQGTSPYTLDAYLNTGSAAPGRRFQYVPNWWAVPAAVQGQSVADLTTADLNGDGRADLLVSVGFLATVSPGSVVVLVNADRPGDRTAAAYPLPANSDSRYNAGGLAVADLNADGHPDVVVNSGRADLDYDDQFNAAFGDGTGALGGWTSYSVPVGGFTGGAAAADVNGDGAAEAAVINFWEDTSGSTAGANVYLGINRGDGVLDVNLKRPFASTDGGLAPPPAAKVVLRDVDGDLRPDLVVLLSNRVSRASGADRVLVYLNSGSAPYFDPANPVVVPIPGGGSTFIAEDLAVADFTNDGLADLLVLSFGGAFLITNTSPPGQPGVAFGLAAGGTAAGSDLVIAQDAGAATVQGEVFEDTSRNNRRDAGEAGRAGTFVFADLNRNGRYDAGEPHTTTIARGLYALSGLAPGAYSVGVHPEDGWHPTAFAEVTVGGSGPARADFARVRRLLGDIGPQTVRVGDRLAVTVPRTGAAGAGLVFSLEGAVPAGLTIHPATGRLEWSPTAAHAGTHVVTVRVRDPLSPSFTETRTVTVDVTAPPVVPTTPKTPLIAVGGTGGVRVFAADGAPRLTLAPFGEGFAGEVRVATGDLTGDGVDDIVTAAGPGGGPHVKVFDGATGAELLSFYAFEPAFAGGVFVAAGDVTGDGRADIVVGAGAGGGPHVRVFDGRTGTVVSSFFALDTAFAGGVMVAVGDLNGDGRADVVTTPGAGGGPRVQAFDG
ncbi:MAG: FG-GAP-like repeat-containing protein, partial [Gemmataceae bacterium]|nr:FG-GAP-like repeat-containing protein [Gemmataceae bacterium]